MIVVDRIKDLLQTHVDRITSKIEELELVDQSNSDLAAHLQGVIEGLVLSGLLSSTNSEGLTELLSSNHNGRHQRPGREISFLVKLTTEKEETFDFVVAASNPSDAYFQLTKRSSYKAIPDIIRVEVFRESGVNTGAAPVKSFASDELVFSSQSNQWR